MKPCGRHVTQLHHDQRKDLKYSSDEKVMTRVVCLVDNLLFVWGQFLGKGFVVISCEDGGLSPKAMIGTSRLLSQTVVVIHPLGRWVGPSFRGLSGSPLELGLESLIGVP